MMGIKEMIKSIGIHLNPANPKLVSFSDTDRVKIVRDVNGCVIGLLESDEKRLYEMRINKRGNIREKNKTKGKCRKCKH
jgi:hypothetical protein